MGLQLLGSHCVHRLRIDDLDGAAWARERIGGRRSDSYDPNKRKGARGEGSTSVDDDADTREVLWYEIQVHIVIGLEDHCIDLPSKVEWFKAEIAQLRVGE